MKCNAKDGTFHLNFEGIDGTKKTMHGDTHTTMTDVWNFVTENFDVPSEYIKNAYISCMTV